MKTKRTIRAEAEALAFERDRAITDAIDLRGRRTKAQRLVEQMAICEVAGASEKGGYAVVRVPFDLWYEVHDTMLSSGT